MEKKTVKLLTCLHKKLTIRGSEKNKFCKITSNFASTQGVPTDTYLTHSVANQRIRVKTQIRGVIWFFRGLYKIEPGSIGRIKSVCLTMGSRRSTRERR
jgi:hypothetical protein